MSNRRTPVVAVILVVTCLLAACGGEVPPGGPYVWIDVPTDGKRVEVGQEVRVEGHASHREGITRVEIWVNGGLYLIEEDPPAEGGLAHFDQMWVPPGAGEYTVEAVAVATDGSESTPDTVRVFVGTAIAEATPVPTATPVESPTDTPIPEEPTETPTPPPPPPATATPTPPPEPVIEFSVDDEEVSAGSCTTVRWRVEHVQAIYYNGLGVSGQESRQTCPCEDETHTLIVQLADGSQEQRSIIIRVNGSCATPTPPPDTTPPPAPTLLKPLDEVELDCTSKVMLRWESVSDPSGIAEYRVQVERHSGDNNWQPVAGSPWKGLSATELELDVECGWYYRWRVRAVDGANNAGSFSDWFEFTVTLI